MPNQLSHQARRVETLLDQGGENGVTRFLNDAASRHVEAKGSTPSNYDLFAIRRNDELGEEVFRLKPTHVGTYSDELLYGAARSPVLRFRSAIQALRIHADRTAALNEDGLEYGHQAALVWVEIGQLKQFIGASPIISEIVAELRTARFQFVRKDTPHPVMQSLAAALGLISEAKRFDTALVDRCVDVLETAGIDSFAPDSLREGDA